MSSPGRSIRIAEVLDTYMENEGRELSAGYFSRYKRLKAYFGGMTLAEVTTAALTAYKEARLEGKLGSGRSREAAYATKNREYQRDLRRVPRGIPAVPREKPLAQAPHTGSVRHELKQLRQALKAFVARSDTLREQAGTYVMSHPVLTFSLPSPASRASAASAMKN